MQQNLVKDCIKSIDVEIEAFNKEITYLKKRLSTTQKVIKSFYKGNYSEEKGNGVRKSLIENKSIILELKKGANTYEKLEKFNQHLGGESQYKSDELNQMIEQLIYYFEKKEAYESCSLFQKLQLKMIKNN
jgi:hypothetical protein